jgi:hypothetical protein
MCADVRDVTSTIGGIVCYITEIWEATILYYSWGGLMTYAVEMSSCGMVYLTGFMNTGTAFKRYYSVSSAICMTIILVLLTEGAYE